MATKKPIQNWTFFYDIPGKGRFIFGTWTARKPKQTKIHDALEKAAMFGDHNIDCWGFKLTEENQKAPRFGLQPQEGMPIFTSTK